MIPIQGGHVLIVEDELVIGLGIQALLEPMGFSTFAFASTGGQALEAVRTRRPDLVTIDVGLLDGDGVDAARAIARACAGVPIVFVTGSPGAVAHLADAVVLEKPVEQAQLAQAIAQASKRL